LAATNTGCPFQGRIHLMREEIYGTATSLMYHHFYRFHKRRRDSTRRCDKNETLLVPTGLAEKLTLSSVNRICETEIGKNEIEFIPDRRMSCRQLWELRLRIVEEEGKTKGERKKKKNFGEKSNRNEEIHKRRVSETVCERRNALVASTCRNALNADKFA